MAGKRMGLKPIGALVPADEQPEPGYPRIWICKRCRALICEGDHMRIHWAWHDEWEVDEEWGDPDDPQYFDVNSS